MKIEYNVPELDLFNVGNIIEVQNTDNDKSIFNLIIAIDFSIKYSYIKDFRDKCDQRLKYPFELMLSAIMIGGYYNNNDYPLQPIKEVWCGWINYDRIKSKCDVVGCISKDLLTEFMGELDYVVEKYPGNPEKINQLRNEMMEYVKNDNDYEITPIELDIKKTNIKVRNIKRIEFEIIKNED